MASPDCLQHRGNTEASSYESGRRVDDEHREVLVSHVLIWTAGDDRASSETRSHCARRVEIGLGAEHARSVAPRSSPKSQNRRKQRSTRRVERYSFGRDRSRKRNVVTG